tara:strand:- start:243 stop:719 length:477 start_codon:yes stop_codon:yes gene_type:complete
MPGFIHLLLAITCLALGAMVFMQRKGSKRHRLLGHLYSISLLLVNISALFVYEDSVGAGPFHVLALISLATLSAGFIPAFLRKPANWTSLHAYFMSWSYVGLVAAGVAQIATELLTLPTTITVGLPSLIVIGIGGLMIHTRLPSILAKLTNHIATPNI